MNILKSFEKMSETAVINNNCLDAISVDVRKAYENNDFLALRGILAKRELADINTISGFSDTNTISGFSDTNTISG